MTQVATYSPSELVFTGASHGYAPEPKGKFLGIIALGALGISLGTGSDRVWIRGLRVESAHAEKASAISTLAPVSLLRRIRRISGLTWDELSTAFSVSTRALHNWDAGGLLRQKHLQRLHEVAGLFDRLDRGNPVYLRNLLLKDFGGQNALVMLRAGQLKEVEVLLGAIHSTHAALGELPDTEFRKRIPQGISLASYSSDQSVRVNPGRPLKAIKPPRPRKV